MQISIVPDTFNAEMWNAVANHPLQSWEWGEARKETGVTVLRIGVFENNTLVSIFQMTLHPVPKTPWVIGYLPRSVMPPDEVLQFLQHLADEHNIIFTKIEPDVKKSDVRHVSPLLTKSTHPLFPQWTQVLDLSKTEETLMKEMKSKTRYNIRLAEKKGVTVQEESTDQGFETFSKLYFDTTKRQQYFGHTKTYHRIVWNNLKGHISHILIAYYKDMPLSAYELFYFKNKLYYPYGGSSDEHREVMASNLIMWEAIKLGKKLGATEFDMWGSLPEDYDRSAPWSGFTRFKEGYGTSFFEFIGSYDLVHKSLLYQGYSVAHTIRNKLLKLVT